MEVITDFNGSGLKITTEHLLAFEQCHPELLRWDVDYKREMIFDTDTVHTIHVLIENKPAGELIIQFTGDQVAEVLSITTLPDYRGMGIGRVLITNMINFCKENGITQIYGNARAGASQYLSQRFGATELFPINNYYGTGEVFYHFVMNIRNSFGELCG